MLWDRRIPHLTVLPFEILLPLPEAAEPGRGQARAGRVGRRTLRPALRKVRFGYSVSSIQFVHFGAYISMVRDFMNRDGTSVLQSLFCSGRAGRHVPRGPISAQENGSGRTPYNVSSILAFL